MNPVSFLDELMQLNAMRPLIEKHAYGGGTDQSHDTTSVDIPHGMMGSGAVPESLRVDPSEAATRVPRTANIKPLVQTGHIGNVTMAKDPIDRFKYNRAYRDRR